MDFTYCSVCLNFMCIHINYICTICTCTVIKGRLNRLRTVSPFPGPFCLETVLEGHHSDSNWTTSGFANSQNATLWTSQLADWTSCGLRSGVLQAGSDSSPVSERPRSTVPVALLCPGRRCWHSATAAFQQPSTSCSTTFLAQYLWLPGLFSGQPHCLGFSPRFYPRPDHQCRLFQTSA